MHWIRIHHVIKMFISGIYDPPLLLTEHPFSINNTTDLIITLIPEFLMHFKIGTLPLVCRILAFLKQPQNSTNIIQHICKCAHMLCSPVGLHFIAEDILSLTYQTDTTTCNAYGEQYVKSNRTALHAFTHPAYG